MDNLDIIRQILSELGGGAGDAPDEYVRHILPMIMWALIFTTGWSLSGQSPNRRGRWLLFAIAGAFIQEFVQLVIKFGYSDQSTANTDASTQTLLERINGPISDGSLALMFLVLSVAMARFIYSHDDRARHMRLSLISVLVISVSTLVLLAIWLYITQDGMHRVYQSSLVHLLLVLGCIMILARAVWRLWRLRSESNVSRIAWVPFAFYLVSQVLLLIVVFGTPEQNQWLVPISNNLVIWATPWFGYVYWRELIEEQQHLALRLHQAERLDVVGRLAAGVAHDFNNHLQSILGFAEVGLQEAKSDVRHQSHYDSIMESVDRARVLVKQLMAFRREAPDAEITVVNLPNVITELAPMLTSLMGSSIEVVNHLDPKANSVQAERSMLEQAIVNVVVNARDAMPTGGTLTVRSRFLPASFSSYTVDMVRIGITDTGRGMTAYERERVFEPFYTTKSAEQGSGLGLASSLSAIQGMGGEMTIDSQPGKGTTLIIDLPAADNAPQDAPILEEEEPVDSFEGLSGYERILVAEDEPGLRHIASLQLKRAGYDVALARDGVHAMELLTSSASPFDLLLLDVMMPRKDGYSVYQEAKRLYPGIRVVFVTANIESKHIHAADAPHIAKPFKQHSLLNLVRRTLDEPHRQTQKIKSTKKTPRA